MLGSSHGQTNGCDKQRLKLVISRYVSFCAGLSRSFFVPDSSPFNTRCVLRLHDLAFRYDNWYWSAHDVALALIHDEIELLDHEIYLLEQERQKLSLMIALEPDVQSEQYVCDE